MRVFGSRVCICQTGDRRAKSDHHHFDEIFIGFTATNQNICYIDVTSGVVKQSHHAVFDEAWYLQPSRPPAPQLLYDLRLEDNAPVCDAPGDTEIALYPPTPCLKSKGPDKLPIVACHLHLPLWESVTPSTYGTCAATVTVDDPFSGTVFQCNRDAMIVTEFGITLQNMEQVFFSPTGYNDAFEEYLDMICFYPTSHPAGGMHFFTEGDRLILQHMAKELPCAKIRDWCSRLKGAWLISVNNRPVLSVKENNEILTNASRLDHHNVPSYSHTQMYVMA
jgi:hypothetical protein